MGGSRDEIVVDGETFIVRRTNNGAWTYDWVSGPNPGYGFASAPLRGSGWSDGGDGSMAPGSGKHIHPDSDQYITDHEEVIRSFLADIDPETGFLSD